MDGLTPGIDNDDDSGDLARVIIRQADLPPDWNVWLSSAADVNVTVYDLSSGEAVLGFHAGGQTIYEVPTDSVVAGDIQFGVESNDLLHYGTLANAPLILELRDEYFDLLCRDEVNLRLSSWVMTSNLDQAETVYVRQLPPEDPLAGESAQFVADLQATLAGSGTNLVVIDDPYYGGDVWVQDQIEIGFTSYRDGSSLPVVFNSPRDRTDIPPNHGLRDFAERELFRADMGYFTTGSDAGTQDSFGNLEVTPPVTVNGKEYTFGRIYTGMGMQLDIQLNFLSRQVVQDPFTLYTGWLKVEHVDEVITFVPDLFAGGGAFKILIADPTLGTSILESEPNPGAKTIGKPGTMTVQEALDAYRTGNINYYPPNTASIKIALMSELGLGEGAFIAIPGFFQYPGAGTGTPVYNEGSSLLPNLANVLVVNGRLIVAEPFYDGFKNAFVASLSAIGYEQGSTVHFIDDWSVYHENYGDVHCGTQVRRAPSRVDWWMHEGN
jgi:protein-arginine deiminase